MYMINDKEENLLSTLSTLKRNIDRYLKYSFSQIFSLISYRCKIEEEKSIIIVPAIKS